jgi:TRAP-type C4-dicarboxylate transport system permease large subunit
MPPSVALVIFGVDRQRVDRQAVHGRHRAGLLMGVARCIAWAWWCARKAHRGACTRNRRRRVLAAPSARRCGRS